MTQRLFMALAVTAGLSFAQQTGISGRLTDPSSATLVNAIVSARAAETRQRTEGVTPESCPARGEIRV